MARVKQTSIKQKNIVEKAPRKYPMKIVAKKTAPITMGIKKPHRFHPGTIALREIRKFQKSTELLKKELKEGKNLTQLVA